MTRAYHAVRRDRKERRRLALGKPCDECGAESGAQCIGSRGALRRAPHRSRMTGFSTANVVSIHHTPGTNDKAAEIVKDAAIAAAVGIEETYGCVVEKCESPIERIIVAQFLHPHLAHEWDMQCNVLLPSSGAIEHAVPPPIPGAYLWPQIKIGPHRVDFVFAVVHYGETHMAIIECDGHDFHERTKEQAQRDKARDRYLIGRGYRVLRFTGSEIYRDPEEVWTEIFKITLGLCD